MGAAQEPENSNVRRSKEWEQRISAKGSDFSRMTNGVTAQVIKIASVASPPTEISLVIGDAVHNLRSALDHLMVTIVGKRGSQIAFPMAKDGNNPGAHSTYGLIKKNFAQACGPSHRQYRHSRYWRRLSLDN